MISGISKGVRKYLPVRKKNQGVTPGMSSKGLSNKENSEDDQW